MWNLFQTPQAEQLPWIKNIKTLVKQQVIFFFWCSYFCCAFHSWYAASLTHHNGRPWIRRLFYNCPIHFAPLLNFYRACFYFFFLPSPCRLINSATPMWPICQLWQHENSCCRPALLGRLTWCCQCTSDCGFISRCSDAAVLYKLVGSLPSAFLIACSDHLFTK